MHTAYDYYYARFNNNIQPSIQKLLRNSSDNHYFLNIAWALHITRSVGAGYDFRTFNKFFAIYIYIFIFLRIFYNLICPKGNNPTANGRSGVLENITVNRPTHGSNTKDSDAADAHTRHTRELYDKNKKVNTPKPLNSVIGCCLTGLYCINTGTIAILKRLMFTKKL